MQQNINKEQARLATLPRYIPTEVMCNGKKIRIPDAASYLFIYNEMFRKEIYKFSVNKRNPLIIDCGANIGLSILYFKKLYPESSIIAFEADPAIFKYLQYNISKFDLSDINLLNQAVWKEEGFLNFETEGADSGKLTTENKVNSLKVETVKLSTFLNTKVDFLKVDIEGAEYEVIRECSSMLRNVDRLFLEYHSYQGKNQCLDELLELIKKAGFRYVIQHGGAFSKHPFERIETYAGMDLQLNIFAYREEN